MELPVTASMSDPVVVVVWRSLKMKLVIDKLVECGGRGDGGLRLWKVRVLELNPFFGLVDDE